jgi:hypothetical protein
LRTPGAWIADELKVGVLAPYDVTLPVVDHRPVAMKSVAPKRCRNDRKNKTNRTDDHQDDPNGSDVESVLIGAGCDCEIEDRTDSECNDTGSNPGNHFVSTFLSLDSQNQAFVAVVRATPYVVSARIRCIKTAIFRSDQNSQHLDR